MQINRESIPVHARERLDAPRLAENRQGQIEAFKGFLKLETERLRMRHRFGLGGSEIATGRSYQIDMVVTRACQVAAGSTDRVTQRELQQRAPPTSRGSPTRSRTPWPNSGSTSRSPRSRPRRPSPATCPT